MNKVSKQLILAVTLSVMGSTVIMGNASAAEADKLDKYSGEEYVVTATRTELEEEKVPNTVEVITKEKIEQLGATDVYSALRLASNINVASAGMAGHNVMIRGMSTNHSLILIDGQRFAGEDTSATQNVYALGRVSLSNIERIEIVRGATSAQYGSDALGGVINIITKKGAEQSTTIGLSTATDQINNYYHFNTGKTGKFTGSFDARFTDNRERTNSSGGTNLFGPVQNFNFNGAYEVGKDKEINFSAGYYNEHTRAKYADSWTSSGMLQTKKDNKEWYDYRRYDYSLGYSGKDNVNDYMLRAFYSKLEKDNRQYNNRNTFPGPMEGILGGMYPKYDWDSSEYSMYGIEGHNAAKLSDKHVLTYGGEYRKTAVEGTRLGDGGDNIHQVSQNGVTKDYSEKELNSYAFYVQDEWQVNNKLLIIPSVRYDHDSSFGGETSPKIGATYFLSDNSRVKANWGKGFKAPTISEMYMNMHRSMGGGIVNTIGNADLQPEKSTMWDISFEAEKDNNYGKITYFNNSVKNLINSEPIDGKNDPVNGSYWYQNVNVDEAQINGVELELGRYLNDNWTIKMTSNWIDATNETTGSRLTGRAKNTSTVQLMYDDNDDYGYNALLWAQMARSYQYDENNNYNYHTFNFVVNKKLGEGNRIYFALDNIFDKEITDIGLDGKIWRAGFEMTF